jgi:hypothetical protein
VALLVESSKSHCVACVWGLVDVGFCAKVVCVCSQISNVSGGWQGVGLTLSGDKGLWYVTRHLKILFCGFVSKTVVSGMKAHGV